MLLTCQLSEPTILYKRTLLTTNMTFSFSHQYQIGWQCQLSGHVGSRQQPSQRTSWTGWPPLWPRGTVMTIRWSTRPGLMTRWNFWSSMTTWWNLYIFQLGSPLCEMDAGPVLQDKGTALQLSVILVLFVAFIWWMEGNVRLYQKLPVIFMQTHWRFQSFGFHDYATNGCVCMICRSSSNCLRRLLLELENIHFKM